MSLASALRSISQYENRWNLEINRECEELFTQLHEVEQTAVKNKALVALVKGLRYGDHERHRLDIYHPKHRVEDVPVAVYFHGGGFTAGDNDITRELYGNIGYHIASQGFVCALATYRLIPEAQYPDGSTDVTACLQWLRHHVQEYGGSPSSLHAFGHSAGGAHLGMALFNGRLDDLSTSLRSITFMSVPFWYDLSNVRRRAAMMSYYATNRREEVLHKTALELFNLSDWPRPKADANRTHGLKVHIMLGQFDSDEIVTSNIMMLESWRTRLKQLPVLQVLDGHNHVSYVYAIGLEDEMVGPKMVEVIRANGSDARK